ncbi:MAG: hypothetical protein Q7S53_03525 [bacterium]|nr:hypothetical protein [bacterium]
MAEAVAIILKGGWNWKSSVPYMAVACFLKIIIIGCIGVIASDMSGPTIDRVESTIIVAALLDAPISILAVKLFVDELRDIRRGR